MPLPPMPRLGGTAAAAQRGVNLRQQYEEGEEEAQERGGAADAGEVELESKEIRESKGARNPLALLSTLQTLGRQLS